MSLEQYALLELLGFGFGVVWIIFYYVLAEMLSNCIQKDKKQKENEE